MTNPDELCQILEWDSNFFGFPIARLNTRKLNQSNIHQVLYWCQANSVKCLYFLAASDGMDSIGVAEANGFHLVDLRITLENQLNEKNGIKNVIPIEGLKIRTVIAEDILLLENIARCSYHLSRFYMDSNFPRKLCDDLYATWIKQSCEGGSKMVLVADINSKPVGYVTCDVAGENKGEGKIGLLGIDPEYRGLGIGLQLVDQALYWFKESHLENIKVVTQGRNVQAIRLYQKCAFFLFSVDYWYHRWF